MLLPGTGFRNRHPSGWCSSGLNRIPSWREESSLHPCFGSTGTRFFDAAAFRESPHSSGLSRWPWTIPGTPCLGSCLKFLVIRKGGFPRAGSWILPACRGVSQNNRIKIQNIGNQYIFLPVCRCSPVQHPWQIKQLVVADDFDAVTLGCSGSCLRFSRQIAWPSSFEKRRAIPPNPLPMA